MGDAAKATEPTPNATIVDDEDGAASAQLYWMMIMICKGAALNTVFLAGDSEGLEAWRQLTESTSRRSELGSQGNWCPSCLTRSRVTPLSGSPLGSVR